MDLGLLDKVVVVTGASRGIGRATALAFAAEGARVALTYRARRDAAEAAVAEIAAAGGHGLALRMDLSDPDTIAEAVAAVRDRWGGIDGLVANAVRWPDRLPDPDRHFEDVPVSEWTDLWRPNTEGMIALMQAALPAMRGRADGRIVLVSSDVARHRGPGHPGLGIYGAAKASISGLANGLIAELGGDILVNIVAPGLTVTEHNLAAMPQSARDAQIARTPTGRLSTPDDVARAIVFLCSAANGNITGDTVNVTGGI
ncbi:MAG TPA: SDR family oxidoreductase [Stackebrandtia sp.]|jgi:3-oxoacyl-[acyl-carrier protein] reductase|uniref:SDR family NAD(P)-dependent oxidoreductase n=1 Tax=Stackebrandtia sp. TaxID=2023065 RepID=UPI002D442AC7|nr:SDR family oxidoreductase [Stackebrandtia sp.]HZE39819.1 SDR family oxidoreductase [Stackebrandtia sp.]